MEDRNIPNERVDRIKKTLNKMGYSYEALKPREKAYLEQIDESIQSIFAAEREAKLTLSRSVVSTQSVSNLTGIARQTFYNNEILNEFVQYYAKEFQKVDMSNQQNKADKKIQELQKELELMHLRDIEFEEMKIQIEELKKEIQDRDEIIKWMKESQSTTIISFHPNGLM